MNQEETDEVVIADEKNQEVDFRDDMMHVKKSDK